LVADNDHIKLQEHMYVVHIQPRYQLNLPIIGDIICQVQQN
jgi:hypothetical protein